LHPTSFNKILNVKELQNYIFFASKSWIKTKKPAAPKIEIKKDASQLKINWREQGKVKAFWFVVYAKDRNGWSHSILPRSTKSIALSATRQISQIVVTGVDRLGNESLARHTILKR
jgi:hypothetical protein